MLAIPELSEIEAIVRRVMSEELKPIREKLLFAPDETVISDEEAAKRKNVSVSTLRRMKVDGRIHSIPTPKGRMCRVCDVEVGLGAI